MQPIYLRMTRNEAVALMLDVDPTGKLGIGICGERQGVVAIETWTDFELDLGWTNRVISEGWTNRVISEAEFFAADSLSSDTETQSKPYFTVQKDSFGTGWTLGETLELDE